MYFKAQASHLAHLARKLEAAVDDAMSISADTRRTMIADALAKRFPADEMMDAYASAWAEVCALSLCTVCKLPSALAAAQAHVRHMLLPAECLGRLCNARHLMANIAW